MPALSQTPLSVLDLAHVRQGGTIAEAFRNTVDLARHAEHLGYRRFWLAEHHNIPGVASAATAVLIGHVANSTKTIRVGSGGIMLPNHPPLVIAEQFGTLEALYPGRIDLGLGRAPGGDASAARALRTRSSEEFPALVEELRRYLGPRQPGAAVAAYPGANSKIPIWLLGSSLFSAALAAELGLPFAFASHFQPQHLLAALDLYRRSFRPSETLDRPYTMAGVPVIAAETDLEAHRLATTVQQISLNLIRNQPGPLPPPLDSPDLLDWTHFERAAVDARMAAAVIGDPDHVRQGLQLFLDETQVDELMIVTATYDHAARQRSYKLVAQALSSTVASAQPTLK